MPKYAARTDANHAELREALRKTGWYVKDMSSVGHGWFDLVVAKGGRVCFIEIKDGKKPPSARQLTYDEAELHRNFKAAGAEVVILESLEDLAQLNRPGVQ